MGVYDEEEPSIFRKYRVLVVVGIITVIAIAAWFGKGFFDQASRSRRDQQVLMIDLPPPALLPPPAPPASQAPPPKEVEQKMIEQEPVDALEAKPDQTPRDEAPAADLPGLVTSNTGDGGADAFGLRAGNGAGHGTGAAISRGTSSRWGWYATQVQGAISQALQGNHHTRAASFRIVAQVWSDRTGRIARAHLVGSSGNKALDQAITKEVLVGLVLPEPPPAGMPMPIVLRLTARPAHVALSR